MKKYFVYSRGLDVVGDWRWEGLVSICFSVVGVFFYVEETDNEIGPVPSTEESIVIGQFFLEEVHRLTQSEHSFHGYVKK